MSENLRVFNEHTFCTKMIARGHNCFVHTIEGTYKFKTGPLVGKTWEKDTVYRRKDDGTFLEYVRTSTGSWFKVTNEILLEQFKLFY